MEKRKKIPMLRFSEFDGEWEKSKLGDIGEVITGKTPSTANANLWDGEIQFVTPTDIDDNKYQISTQRTIKRQAKTRVLPSKSIMFTCIASIGKMSLSINPCITNQQINSIIPSEDYDNEYVFYALKNIVGFIQSTQNTNTLPIINKTEFSKFYLFFPNLPEQQKIASFFTAIDQKISQLKKKHQLLEQYKKGVMQQIFSQQIRFKDDDGREFPKWEKKRLGDCLEYVQPTKYIVDSTEYDDSYKTPVLTAGKSFILGYTDETDGIFKTELPIIIFDDFTTSSKFVDFPFKVKSSAMKILIAKKDTDVRFIFEAMQVLRYEVGGHERHWISKFAPMQIFIPSLPEQTKIANFLSAIDDKIQHTKKQIEQAEQWKKGLMQKMFV